MDRKPLIISIRYSVLQNNPAGWELGKHNAFADYKAKLFSDERLSSRLHMLRNVTVPSILGQTDPSHIHVVLVASTEMPPSHLDALKAYVRTIPNARVVLSAPHCSINHRGPLNDILVENDYGLHAHVRHDDDDALSSNYAERLRAYMTAAHIGMGVSFSRGYGGLYDEPSRRYTEFRELVYPKLACGFAMINRFNPKDGTYETPHRTIYELGSHTKADLKAPIIIDEGEPTYIYSIYRGQDTSEMMLRRLGPQAPTEEVLRAFSLPEGIHPAQTPRPATVECRV